MILARNWANQKMGGTPRPSPGQKAQMFDTLWDRVERKRGG